MGPTLAGASRAAPGHVAGAEAELREDAGAGARLRPSETASPATASILPRGQQRGKQQSQSDAQEGLHTLRGPALPASSLALSPGAPPLLAPPTTPSLPNRRRRGYDRGRRRSCWGGRTLNGRSRRRGDVTRRRTCRALRIPAAFLPLPWVGDGLVRNLQLLFRSQHSCGAACGGRRVWWIESHSTSCPS